MIISYLFLVGLIFGSFFNVVGLRIPKGQSIVKPRSACPSCQHQLTAWELIPVFSYVLQGGKCRKCGISISPVYPFFELMTGILFAIAPLVVASVEEFLIYLTLVSLMVIITVSDVAYMIIPDKVLLFFAGLFTVERIFYPLTQWWDSLVGAAVGFGLLLLIAVVSRGGMGGGDIKLFGVIGLVLGTKAVLLSFFFSTLVGVMIGLIGILIGKVKRKKPMPFGPSIAIGTIVYFIYGQEILDWYFHYFLM
ncbi:leader peptidase (prepilin peptidase)/N-methyltransferase [Bacillus fengqiuensis]|nr:leader peptidase (prepilin peptidase)/N-methyltransferase [Bacillus fengqiuensis]